MSNQLMVMPTMEISDALSRRNQVVAFTKEIMIEGTDYGTVPGTKKNTLLKPGAEKLASFFGLTPVFESITAIEDWTGEKTNGEPFFYYRYRCKLYRGEMLVGEGIGSCNSRESKYRWRWVPESEVPYDAPSNLATRQSSIVEFAFAIDKAETSGKYGKPLEYWQEWQAAISADEARPTTRKTARGEQLDAWERTTVLYRVPNEDIFSQVNTIDKMSQKRALVSAVLIAVNASEFFTQDLEDFDHGIIVESTTTVVEEPQAKTEPQPEPKPNGKKKPPPRNYIDDIFDEVQWQTDNYYDHKAHLYNAIGGQWPKEDDTAAIEQAISNAVNHANSKEG